LKEIYPDYVTEGLEDPPIIKEHTETYWKENDTYQQFINDWICEAVHPDGTRDVRAMLTLSKIYTQFKTWFKDNFPGAPLPDRGAVRNHLRGKLGPMRGRGWFGIQFSDPPIAMAGEYED
jgi:hypothetical protein